MYFRQKSKANSSKKKMNEKALSVWRGLSVFPAKGEAPNIIMYGFNRGGLFCGLKNHNKSSSMVTRKCDSAEA